MVQLDAHNEGMNGFHRNIGSVGNHFSSNPKILNRTYHKIKILTKSMAKFLQNAYNIIP